MGGIEETQAIVIGGSIGGLLAARVLADRYDSVTIIERDPLPVTAAHRRGVPHGRHAHALLAGGLRVVEELFPGFTGEVVGSGAVPADPAADGSWFMEGGFLKKTSSGEGSIMLSRPFLETRIREKVVNTRGVTIVDGLAVRGLEIKKGRTTGVMIDDGVLTADLIVDASGRGSQSPKWLEMHGFGRPDEEKVEVQLSYVTRHFQRRTEHLDGDRFLVVPHASDEGRGGVALSQEGDRWIVTLFGYFGQSAREDLDGFIDFARTLPSPAIYELIKQAEPIGEACSFKCPASTRRHYERMKRFPDGFLVFGDSICSFNPIYGQGMSASALQAKALSDVLNKGDRRLAKRFFQAAAKVIDGPWSVAVGGDLRMPQTSGKRTVVVNFINWYLSKLHKLGHTNESATRAFIRVAQLLDPPTAILAPTLAARVLGKALSTNLRSAFNLKIGQLFSNDSGASGHDKPERARSV